MVLSCCQHAEIVVDPAFAAVALALSSARCVEAILGRGSDEIQTDRCAAVPANQESAGTLAAVACLEILLGESMAARRFSTSPA